MAAIDDALASGTGFFTTLLKIKATAENGGTELRVALHDAPITFNSQVYDAAPFTPSQIQSKSGVEADNAVIQHLLGTDMSRTGLVGGKWGGATIEIMQIDYRHPEWGYSIRRVGRIGDAGLKGYESESQFRGLMDLLNQPVGERTSTSCRYQLGETKCGVNLASFTRTGSVSSITNRQKFTVNLSPAAVDDYYRNGLITWTSGPNSGLKMETVGNVGNVITLFAPMLSAVAAGHNFSIVAGDDKLLATCHTKFANAINFGGEPDMPTRESIYKIPE